VSLISVLVPFSNSLSVLSFDSDCLISLAITATQPGFTKPIFTDEHQLDIEGGFHPMVTALKDDTYVPVRSFALRLLLLNARTLIRSPSSFQNAVHLSKSHGRTKIITGPNMGGKSSLVRMIALTVLLAQVGSYVPASSVKLGVHDAILTRMGANDDFVGGKSTFMVSLASSIYYSSSKFPNLADPTSSLLLSFANRSRSAKRPTSFEQLPPDHS